MGAATSINSTNVITKAITNITNEIVQKSISTNDQSIVIKINNTKGDVEVSNVGIKQIATIDTKAVFSALNTTENKNKVNQDIEQIAKSLIKGLNLAQVSVSSSSVSSVIDNCISIKDTGLLECINKNTQNFNLEINNTKGNVKISDIQINQVSESISSCILSSESTKQLQTETDTKIKQLSSTSAHGLDLSWLSLIFIIGGGAFAFTFNKVAGPLIFGVGVSFCLWGYNQENAKYDHDPIVSSNYLNDTKNITGLSLIKTEEMSQKKNVSDYGEADIYESYLNKIRLYKGSIKISEIKEKTRNDFNTDVTVIIKTTNSIGITLKDSEKFKEQINITLPINVLKVQTTEPKGDEMKNGTVYVDFSTTKYSGLFKIYYIENNKLNYYGSKELTPTIISYKNTSTSAFKSLFKNIYIIIGLGLVAAGAFLYINSMRNNNNKGYQKL